MDYYKAAPAGNSMTVISTLTGEYLYLIEGTSSALLVDVSTGVGNLPAFVQELTDKPVTVVLTHGHVDHASGAAAFKTVYLHPSDLDLYRRHCCERNDYVRSNLGVLADQLSPTDLKPVELHKMLLPLRDGDIFDLGGIHVEILSFPGHTKGSVVLLVLEPRLLILGDACNNSTFVFDDDASTVRQYRDALASVRGRLQGRFDRVFFSHRSVEGTIDVMDNVLLLCDALLSGQADAQPYIFRGQQVYIAKACAPHFVRMDGKCGNLVYNYNRIE